MEKSIPKEMFEVIGSEETSSEVIVRPSLTYFQDAWRRLKENKLAIIGLVTIIVVTLAAIFGPLVSSYTYDAQNFAEANQGVSVTHFLGTDKFGRDLLVRILYGTRVSLTVGLAASVLNVIIGVLYGGISGYFGGIVDNVMMRIVDIIYSIPMLIYIVLLSLVLGQGLKSIVFALAISFWLTMARIVRGQVLALKEQEFVLAAKTLGASSMRILLRHIIPNCMGPIIVTLTLSIPEAIFTESFLSFIGLGVAAPMASLGTLSSEGLQMLNQHIEQLLFPAITICVIILSFNLLGDGLRDALDPKMRK